jgi:hypothetical protein
MNALYILGVLLSLYGSSSTDPSYKPSHQPLRYPSYKLSPHPLAGHPSYEPSQQPSPQPSQQPSQQPSHQPTHQPTQQPTGQPSSHPSGQPSQPLFSTTDYTIMIIGIIAGVIALPLVISHYCFQTRIKNVFENKDCTERDLDERDYLL